MTTEHRAERNLPRLVIGASIAVAGVLFTLDNLGILQARDYTRYWPVAVVVIGFAQLAQSRNWNGYLWGLIVVFGGFWILGQNLGIISMSIWKLSPLLLVLLGGSLVRRAVTAPASSSARDSEAFVRGTAVMGGFDRVITSPEFEGGDLVAIMGGCKVDLRHATIEGDEAVIDVLAVMGGMELLVPDTWTVDSRVLPLMGAVTMRARVPAAGTDFLRQRLVLRGTVFMGGVEVKN